MPVARIVMYSDQTPACLQAKELLQRHHLSWEETNLSSDAAAAAFVRKLCGGAAAPVFYVNDRWLPTPTEEELLMAAGVRFDVESLRSRGTRVWDVIVIGLGPAGLAACHGCRLGGLSVLGLDEGPFGGHLTHLTEVDEYLGVGFDEDIAGADVAENFVEHARHVGATLMRARVSSVRPTGAFHLVRTNEGDHWARAVVIATGAVQRELKAEGIARFVNRGIRYGAQVDANLYAGRRVAVVGSGDEAFHAAVFLSHHAKHVTVLAPEEQPSAEPILVERAVGNGVRVIPGAAVAAVKGSDVLDFVFFREKGIPEEQGLPIDAMIVALGPAPRQPIPGLERLPQEEGYFAHGEGGKTMLSGVFVAGDCTDTAMRTLMSVVASGSLCAKRVWQWLASRPLPRLA